jgi:hypothetical protein
MIIVSSFILKTILQLIRKPCMQPNFRHLLYFLGTLCPTVFLIIIAVYLSTKNAFPSDMITSDIVEDVGLPPPRKKVSERDISLRSLQEHIYTEKDKQHSLAIVTYPLSRSDDNTPFNWDNLDTFAQVLDQKFFKNSSKKVIAGGAICALFGAVVPHPSCGYVIYNVGDLLHIPVSSGASNALVSWITITTTPAFAQQSYNIGRRLVSFISQEDVFTPTDEKDSHPHVFKKDRLHYIAKYALITSSLINASIPTGLMWMAEKEYPLFFSLTAVPFYAAWMENYYKVGSRNIDHLFSFYRYASRQNYEKREILKKRIDAFRKAISQNDALTESVFNVVEQEKEKGFTANEGDPFAFSALFMRSLSRMEGEGPDEATALLTNFKMDVEGEEPSLFEDGARWVSTFMTGAGIYTKYAVTQSVLKMMLVEMGAPVYEAEIAGASLAAFESVWRLVTLNYQQMNYATSIRNMVRSSYTLMPVRKMAGVMSFVNAGLFSLPNLAAGWRVFEGYDMVSKVAYLTPAFLMDLAYHDSFFNRNYNETITRAATLRSRNIGPRLKRSHLNAYADKADDFISQCDQETIEKLYKIVQKGV